MAILHSFLPVPPSSQTAFFWLRSLPGWSHRVAGISIPRGCWCLLWVYHFNVSPEFRLMFLPPVLLNVWYEPPTQPVPQLSSWLSLPCFSYFSSITGNLQSHPQPGTSEASMIPFSDILCSMHQEILSAPSSKYVSMPISFLFTWPTLVQATILFLLGHWAYISLLTCLFAFALWLLVVCSQPRNESFRLKWKLDMALYLKIS